jgi:hypothetical protein
VTALPDPNFHDESPSKQRDEGYADWPRDFDIRASYAEQQELLHDPLSKSQTSFDGK